MVNSNLCLLREEVEGELHSQNLKEAERAFAVLRERKISVSKIVVGRDSFESVLGGDVEIAL